MYIYRLNRLLLSVLFCLSLSVSLQARQYTIPLAQWGILPDKQDNMSPRFASALEQIRKDHTVSDTITLLLLPGKYNFDSEGATQRELYISNHDQSSTPRSIGILFDRWEHLSLQGQGAQLYFRSRMLPIAIIGGHDVEIRGVSIDFLHPQISQVFISQTEGGTTFQPNPQVQWRINASGQWEHYGDDWQIVPNAAIAFEGEMGHLAYRTADLTPRCDSAELLPSGEIRLPHWQDERLQEGMAVAMRCYERPQPAIFVDKSRDIRLDQVCIHYADGMGLLAQNSTNISLQNFDVRPSKDRYFSTEADATHFSGCRGLISVQNGHYEGMMDDAINVHGIYLKLIKRIDNHTVLGQYMHEQAWGFPWGEKGDSIQFVRSKTFDVVPQLAIIESIEPQDGKGKSVDQGAKVYRIRFRSTLPQSISEHTGIGIENLSKTPSVVFAHNTIRNNRARGTLINTPKPVLIEGNLFDHISGAAILASSDCNQWFESGRTQQLTIRRNIFVDVLTSLYQFTDAVISLHPVIPHPEQQHTPYYGNTKGSITIEDNLFYTFDTPLLYALSTQGLVWRRNTVIPTTTYPKFHWNQEPYKLEYCRDIDIE